MGLLTPGQSEATFRVEGDTLADRMRTAAMLMDELADGEYVSDISGGTDVETWRQGPEVWRTLHKASLSVTVGRC